MKKKASMMRLVMWVMLIYFSIAAVSVMSKSNDTTFLCDGSVEECLNVHHLDSQLPTISSSHFRRILVPAGHVTTPATLHPNPALGCRNDAMFYLECGAKVGNGIPSDCPVNPHNRACSNIQPD